MKIRYAPNGMLVASLWLAVLPFVASTLACSRGQVATVAKEAIEQSDEVRTDSMQEGNLDSRPVHLPFRLTEANNLSMPVMVNGKETLHLMFHTAVDSISLTSKAAGQIESVKIDDAVDVQSWGGVEKAGISRGNRVQMGSLVWENQTFFIDELSGPETDGKFGQTLFDGKIIEVNFDRSELVIHPSLPSFVSEVGSIYRRLDYTSDGGSMFLSGELTVGDSKIPNSFMLHTGFSGTALLDDPFVSRHNLSSKWETLSERSLQDAFGNVVKTKKVKVAAIEFAGIPFENVPIEVFEGSIGRQTSSVLGGELIKRLNLVIDTPNHHLYFCPNSKFEAKFPS